MKQTRRARTEGGGLHFSGMLPSLTPTSSFSRQSRPRPARPKVASGGLRGYTGSRLFEMRCGTRDFSLFERQPRQDVPSAQTGTQTVDVSATQAPGAQNGTPGTPTQAQINHQLDNQITTVTNPQDPGFQKWAAIATPEVTQPVLAAGTSANLRSGSGRNGEAYGSVVPDGNGGFKTVNLQVAGGKNASIQVDPAAVATIHSHPMTGSSKMPSTSFNNALNNPLYGDTVSARASGYAAIVVHRTGVTVFDPGTNSIYMLR